MHFNIAVLFALTATTQLATAAPAPVPTDPPIDWKWNGKTLEAGYKMGAVACGFGAYVCSKSGHTILAESLFAGAICCSGTAAVVTASQSKDWSRWWEKTVKAVGNKAEVVGGGFSAVGKFVAKCTTIACIMVVSAVSGNPPAVPAIPVPAARVRRTIDASVLEAEPLIARYAEIDARSPKNPTRVGTKATEDGGVLEFYGKRDIEEDDVEEGDVEELEAL